MNGSTIPHEHAQEWTGTLKYPVAVTGSDALRDNIDSRFGTGTHLTVRDTEPSVERPRLPGSLSTRRRWTKQCTERFFADSPAKVVSLIGSAPMLLQEIQLLSGFHALGNQLHLQASGHGDNSADDLGVITVMGAVVDE